MKYIGEHLFVGQLGNFFVITSFCFALLAMISYFYAAKNEDKAWGKLANFSFIGHTASVFGIVAVLFYMLLNQYFEYYYVWQHSSKALPLRYIFSCFWEGQEGSFLLWTFWHTVLGSIIIWRNGKLTNSVMAIFSSVQVFLSSMLLGIYILEYKVGSNPFTVFLRDHPEFVNLPLFENSDYLLHLDGRGLNPLLQNYWMIIHPPTLFLGFASTLVPFAYALAGLWKKQYNEWIKPAMPWTIFSVMILGTGILMGGAWAYEALSFGGFWAWDPVENASLVPWLTLVGGMHLMVVQEKKGGVSFTMFGLVLISFILILYSTFLTRSGILGDSSVHAFTDLGMSGQLLIYLLSYVIIAIIALIVNYKSLPRNKKEEDLWTREFWMFTGSLVLFISSFQILISTSIPVINKIFGSSLAPPADAISHYNSWQIPFAILILLFMSFSQFLKYKKSNFKAFSKAIFRSLLAALIITIGIGLLIKMTNPFELFLLFAGSFSVLGNLDYWVSILKGKFRHAGASVAHIGFGIMMIGALISMSQQKNISNNTSSFDVEQLGEEFENKENILLMQNDTLSMDDYYVSYRGKEEEGVNIYFLVEYMKRLPSGEFESAFTLRPRVQTNPRMGNVAEPDTRHFLGKDIYTHVTWAILEEDKKEEEYGEPEVKNVKVRDTLYLKQSIVILDSVRRILPIDIQQVELQESDIAVEAKLTAWDFNTKKHTLRPLFIVKDTSEIYGLPDGIEDIGLKVSFNNINPKDGSVELTFIQKNVQRDFIVMQAIVFPYINLLWLGCFIMIIGTIIAIYSRLKYGK